MNEKVAIFNSHHTLHFNDPRKTFADVQTGINEWITTLSPSAKITRTMQTEVRGELVVTIFYSEV